MSSYSLSVTQYLEIPFGAGEIPPPLVL